MATSLALYVHFPFCLSICPYCDFDRQATGFDRIDAYLDAVTAELAQFTDNRPIHSVFFGGGTPSLMQAGQVARVLDQIATQFVVQADAEITLECNPGDVDVDKLRGFRQAGANRLSFGVQSLDDAMLPLLGRRHSSTEARDAVSFARAAGFDNLSLDFMFGLPNQSLEHWQATLDDALALDPDHLSCYLLTLDEKVPMGRDVERGRVTLPPDDDLADMYQATRARLAGAGFEQYEVSNWAKPGRASRHNLTYWRDGEWIGIGAGAASAYAGRRWKNTPVLERYITSIEASGRAACAESETPDASTRMLDFLSLGLRLREGVAFAEFEHRFALDLRQVLGDTGAWLLDVGLLESDGAVLRVAAERQMVLNEMLSRVSEAVRDYARRETSASHSVAR
jgi:oxygen-independent coproporphyrinogen-3 oxidase